MANLVFCMHCKQYVSRKTAYNHKRKFGDSGGAGDESAKAFVDRNKQDLDLVFCDHCGKTVSRKTRISHLNGNHEPLNKKARMERPSTDVTSDSDDEDDPSGIPDVDPVSESDMSDSNPSDSTEDSGESIWEEDEEDIIPDVSSKNNKKASTNITERARQVIMWIVMSIVFLQCSYFMSNRCLEHILFFISQIFNFLGQYSELCTVVAGMLPVTMHMVKQLFKCEDTFCKYVVCPNCNLLHSYDDVLIHGKSVCKNKVFACKAANSSRKRGRAKCNSDLVRQVVLENGKRLLYPYKIYCFKGIIEPLQKMLTVPGFVDKCNLWRSRNTENLYADVFDGDVWNSFKCYNDTDFLTQKCHFGLALNVDWFAPYKRRRDISIGALYMVVMNLPREERYKTENAILIGLIPAMKKEPESLNHFLEPLVKELKALWKGVKMTVGSDPTLVTVKAALMCAAADIPAARKLCGFMGHSAYQGCSHCTKPLITNSSRDCGVPNLEKWPSRDRKHHVQYSKMAEAAESVSGKAMIESRYGYRYTVLLELEYFHPSKFYAIDPMHNLFLGTAKKMFSHWVESDILSKNNLTQITERISSLKVPYEMGRIPRNIVSNYGQMTAKEWKNWVLVYSLYVLKDILPTPHLSIWQTFVLGCKHLCRPVISHADVDISHGCFLKFVKEVRHVYGVEFVTPNMHLHCHLKECVVSFGSIYGFWLFSFERYNGLLTEYPTNKKSVECQMMRKFEMSSYVNPLNVDDDHRNHFMELLNFASPSNVHVNNLSCFYALSYPLNDVPLTVWSNLSCVSSKQSYKLCTLSNVNMLFLSQVYSTMYNMEVSVNMLAQVAKRYKSMVINNELYTNDIIMASWTSDKSTISDTSGSRPGKINYFLRHTLEMTEGALTDHVFASVDWYKSAENNHGYLPPTSVWQKKELNPGPASFIPIQRIQTKCAWSTERVGQSPVIVVVPLPHNVYI